MNALTNFVFDGSSGQAHPVRAVLVQGEPWFVATDVAAVLGYRNAPDMVRMLDSDEADTHILRIRSENGVEQDREVAIINESGLYACILKSRRPEARAFKKWVTGQVLPSIRKTGVYMEPGAAAALAEARPQFLSHGADIMVAADRTFRSLVRSGRAAGLRTGAAIVRANAITQARTGVDLLQTLDLQVSDDGQGLDTDPTAAGEIHEFWCAVAGGYRGLPGLVPMLSAHAHALYGLWAREQGRRPLSMARLICETRLAGLADTRRLRWRNDMGCLYQSTFLVPDGVAGFDAAAAVARMDAVLPMAEMA